MIVYTKILLVLGRKKVLICSISYPFRFREMTEESRSDLAMPLLEIDLATNACLKPGKRIRELDKYINKVLIHFK